MSKPLNSFYAQQHANFLSALVENWGVREAAISLFERDLKVIEKRYLGLACAATLTAKRAPRNEYALALIEASYLSIILAAKGLENSSSVLLRQCIELGLKHVFFAGHPIEYRWAQSREDFRELGFQSLLDFVRRTDETRAIPTGILLCDRISSAYSVLSRYVHAHAKYFLRYGAGDSRKHGLEKSVETIHKLDQRTKDVWPVLMLLLIIHSPSRFVGANQIEQRLIMYALGRELRLVLLRYLHQLQTFE